MAVRSAIVVNGCPFVMYSCGEWLCFCAVCLCCRGYDLCYYGECPCVLANVASMALIFCAFVLFVYVVVVMTCAFMVSFLVL